MYELAGKALNSDVIINNLQDKVIILDNDNAALAVQYEALLRTSALTIYEKGQREAGLQRIIENMQDEFKSVRKRLTWANIKFYGLIVIEVLVGLLIL